MRETQNTKRKTQNLVLMVGVLIGAGICGRSFAQNVQAKFSETKSSDALRKIFSGLVARGNQSTVVLRARQAEGSGREQVGLGTGVGTEGNDGYVLTKASEVVGRKDLKVMAGLEELAARVVGVSEPLDLAMLRVTSEKAGMWKAVEWAELKGKKVDVGEWVATCGPAAMLGEEPVAVGVVSVGRRRIPGPCGFLGVAMENAANDGGASIQQVLTGSAAEQAGIKVGDTIVAVGGRAVHNGIELREQVSSYRPGDVVMLSVKRAKSGVEEEVQVTLGMGEEDQAEAPAPMSLEALLGGKVSKRSSDFASVFQHDTVVRPVDCGGPIVDLSGKVIGINIARAGRTETYALPADLVVPMLEPMKSGILAPVNANASSTRPRANDK